MLSRYWGKLLNPQLENDKDIRQQLEYINKIEVNVAYPFLMKVYEDYGSNRIDKKTFISILELIQSFVFRRYIVTDTNTNIHNKIFATLYKEIDKDDYMPSLQRSLLRLTGSKRFPRNKEVVNHLRLKEFYADKAGRRTTAYLLERLENQDNKELVDVSSLTIEHIFPQKPRQEWSKSLSPESYQAFKNEYLHRIANITLTGYNRELSNKDFISKRDKEDEGYKHSLLWLNQYLGNLEKWDIEEYNKRFELISERFLKIWQLPNIKLGEDFEEYNNKTTYADLKLEREQQKLNKVVTSTNQVVLTDYQEVNIFDAGDPTGKNLEYAILFGEKYNFTQIVHLFQELFKRLLESSPEMLIDTELGNRLKLTKDPSILDNKLDIGNGYFIEARLNSKDKFKRMKYALELFDAKDQLFIKFAQRGSKK